MKTKIKHREKLQKKHDRYKDSIYQYTCDKEVSKGDTNFGNIDVDSHKIKKVYNYTDVNKRVSSSKKSTKIGNVKIAKKIKVKTVYNNTNLRSIKNNERTSIGNVNFEADHTKGQIYNNVDVSSIKVK